MESEMLKNKEVKILKNIEYQGEEKPEEEEKKEE